MANWRLYFVGTLLGCAVMLAVKGDFALAIADFALGMAHVELWYWHRRKAA
jgi:hypothetical protein